MPCPDHCTHTRDKRGLEQPVNSPYTPENPYPARGYRYTEAADTGQLSRSAAPPGGPPLTVTLANKPVRAKQVPPSFRTPAGHADSVGLPPDQLRRPGVRQLRVPADLREGHAERASLDSQAIPFVLPRLELFRGCGQLAEHSGAPLVQVGDRIRHAPMLTRFEVPNSVRITRAGAPW